MIFNLKAISVESSLPREVRRYGSMDMMITITFLSLFSSNMNESGSRMNLFSSVLEIYSFCSEHMPFSRYRFSPTYSSLVLFDLLCSICACVCHSRGNVSSSDLMISSMVISFSFSPPSWLGGEWECVVAGGEDR